MLKVLLQRILIPVLLQRCSPVTEKVIYFFEIGNLRKVIK